MVTLQFSANKGPFSSLIKTVTWSWASHVDIVLPDGQLIGASPFKGVSIHEAEPSKYKRVERFNVDVPDVVKSDIFEWAKREVGKHYDYIGVFAIGIHRDWQLDHSWFCSEFVASAFAHAEFPLLRAEKLARITPADLLMSPYLLDADPKEVDQLALEV